MPCCGGKRRQAAIPRAEPTPQAPPRAVPPVAFQYTGRTALTVVGPISRTRYRFAAPAARLEVDARDAPYLAGVPHLRRVAT